MIRTKISSLSLRAFFTGHYEPNYLDEAAPGTRTAYLEAIGHFERISGDPPLWRIDAAVMTAFKRGLLGLLPGASPAAGPSPPVRDWDRQQTLFSSVADAEPSGLRRRPMTSKITVNKHLSAVHRILRKAGPAGPRNWDALAILSAVPYVRPCRKIKKKLPREVPPERMAAIYRATPAARHDWGDVPAEHGWKAFLVVAGLVGLRRGTLLSYTEAGVFYPGLTWDAVDLAGGMVLVDPDLDKCDAERRKPLHPIAAQHLMRIRTGDRFVFTWPRSLATLRREWQRIQRAAGLTDRQLITIHDLKRFCGTLFAELGDDGLVDFMLDHAPRGVSNRHYVNHCGPAAKALPRLAVPAAFAEDFSCAVPREVS